MIDLFCCLRRLKQLVRRGIVRQEGVEARLGECLEHDGHDDLAQGLERQLCVPGQSPSSHSLEKFAGLSSW